MFYYAIDNRNNEDPDMQTDVLIEWESSETEIQGSAHLIMTLQQVQNHITGGEFIYKITDTGIIDRPAEEIFLSKKSKHKGNIKEKYFTAIIWSDDEKVFYDKLKATNPYNNEYDYWYAAVMQYWDEAWDCYHTCKNNITEAANEAELYAVEFAPNYTKTYQEIKEMKP